MVDQQTRVRESTAGDEHRLQRLRARYRGWLAVAVVLIAGGLVLTVSAFVTVVRDRDGGARPTAVRAVADEVSNAGLGCDDFVGARPVGRQVLQEARCTTKFGPLHILVYRSEDALRSQQIFFRTYSCDAAAKNGHTKLISVIDGTIRLALPDENVEAARAYQRATRGQIETTDCAAPAPPPPTTAPAPPPEVPPEPAPETPPQ